MKKNDVELGATYVAKVSGKLARVRIERESPYGGWEAVNADTGRRVRIKSAQRLRREAIDPARAKAIAAADQHNARLRDERAASPDGMTTCERAMAESAVTYDPDRCATPRCKREPAMTYLGKPICQACWEAATRETTNDDAESAGEETTMSKKSASKKSTKTAKAAKTTKAMKKAVAAKPKAERKPAGDAKPKRVSALDAAAEVLRKAGKPMRSQEMITAMAEQGLWTSPNGKTPHATLYAAILREINDKGGEARFRKADRGLFEYAKGSK